MLFKDEKIVLTSIVAKYVPKAKRLPENPQFLGSLF
jgi:hypothetical protein